MTYRLTRWLTRSLRPIAFVVATGAVAALWWRYFNSSEVIAALPRGTQRNLLGWLRPLYAIPRLPADQFNPIPMSRVAIDIASSPVFDRLLLAALVALLSAILVATACARRWWTPLCLLLTLGGVLAINVFVARIPEGDSGFVGPFARFGMEYYGDVPRVRDDPIAFIRDYATLNDDHEISHHAGTHPPGGVLFQYFGQRWFGPPEPAKVTRAARRRDASFFDSLFGTAPAQQPEVYDEATARAAATRAERSLDVAVWWAVGFTALAVLPAWWLARVVGGAAAARRLLPMYLATPNLVLYGATCMDGVFTTFCVTALAAGVAAMRRRWSWVWTPLLTIAAGVAFWLASFMTFAAIGVPLLMAFYALCVLVRRRRVGLMMLARAALVGVVFIGCQLAAAHWLQYDLRAVVAGATDRDQGGLGMEHIGGYASFAAWWQVSLANLGAWLLGSGVAITALALVAGAVAIAHGRFRHGPAATFAPAVALTILVLATSTLFTFETERVWMFLTPALLVVATTQFRGCAVWTLLLAASFVQVFWVETQFYLYW